MVLIKGFVNTLADPRLFFLLACVGLAVLIWKREQLASSAVGYGTLGFLGIFFVFGTFDPNFRLIVTKPDNVPIVGLIFLLAFFVWYSLREGVLNDRRIAAGQGPIEKAESDRVWVWPDLVYIELIALVLCSVLLIVWSIFLKAPLEQPANPANTPNPSKAPWYFLGLQEMLVYFDPWLAGVVLPGLIIAGLIAIPYIDRNPKGNGYYTFNERKPEIVLFLFGFAVLWSSLIVLGTFLRGPNWNFFGPFEYWDIHKLAALTNVNLSEYFWIRMLKTGYPSAWAVRELPGIVLVLLYVFALPVLLGKSVFKGYYEKLGPSRYYVTAFLFLAMMSLPLKMLARWILNLKYVVAIPEIFFNI
ncbi:MAG: cytochrome C [Acidobacteria bacterium]|nr:cytochrome C [Acidobacteriota bacterium]